MFPCGMMTVFMPFLYAAMDFSRRPPMGSTRPCSVISPVMAMSCAMGSSHSADVTAVAMAIPADGPSFGTAPSGAWMWISFFA